MNGRVGGTCLKPSFEPIIVARKPFKGSLVDNVIEYGVGGINIDDCRVPAKQGEYDIRHYTNEDCFQNLKPKESKFQVKAQPSGRFPANTILTYDEIDFDEVCGGFPETKPKESASRYFYCAKASKKDREQGLEDFEERIECDRNPELKSAKVPMNRTANPKKNTHPCVKPCELMEYLVRLVSPKGATILDPFMGSGSTGKAVAYENLERNINYSFIGIEKEKEYYDIAEARINYVKNKMGE